VVAWPGLTVARLDHGPALAAMLERYLERCIGCGNCVDACPFGVPKLDVAQMLQYKCNLCYDRTSVGLAPMCATVCPTSAIFYGSVEELEADRPGAQAIDVFRFGEAEVRTGCAVVAPEAFTGPAPGGM
jgi:Fe-S-cluster-containing dehydrogenase component